MTKIFTNLRIGTKLAITSVLSILLIGMMIFGQMSGNAAVRKMNASAVDQQTIANDAMEARASIGGMQIGVRDVRLARAAADLQKASEVIAARQKSAIESTEAMLGLSKSAENHERIEKLKILVGDYARRAHEIATIQSEVIGIEAKRSAGSELPAEAVSRIVKLNEDAARIAREGTLPISAELGSACYQGRGLRKAQGARGKCRCLAGIVVRRKERHDYRYCGGGALDRSLRAFRLHDCPADARAQRFHGRARRWELRRRAAGTWPQGRDRRRRGAVEKFKVVAEQKARDEAETKIKQDQIAAQQRKAEMIKLADGFEAAVGEIIETVSSASTELEASAGTLTKTAERAQEIDHDGRGGFGRGLHQRAVGGLRDRGADVFGQRDQPPGAGIGADGQ